MASCCEPRAPTISGPINVPQEAMYWTTNEDGAGQQLSGQHDYIMHFPPGGLPPNNAFWSLTMGDAKNHFVPNPINRYSVSDRSGLVPNADGSVDIYIQNTAPAGHESNWLPAPTGNFILWLRVYLPGANHSRRRVQGAAGRRSEMMSHMKHKHLLTFGSFMLVAWVLGTFLFIYFWPHIVNNHFKKAIVDQGFGEGPVPINTLYTEPKRSLQSPSPRSPPRARI